VPLRAQPEAAAGVFEYASPGLASLLGSLEPGGDSRVLDLGRASGVNLDFYRGFATSVRFVDLLRDEVRVEDPPALPVTLSAGVLARLLPHAGEPFDLVLAWDLPSYLDGASCSAVSTRLAECGRPGTRLLTMLVAADTMSAAPLSFTLLPGARIRGEPAVAGLCGGRSVPAAEEERRLAPFVVQHSVLLRHGMREVLAVLR
jgi:hypothetical protein